MIDYSVNPLPFKREGVGLSRLVPYETGGWVKIYAI
jgi:hypothetical protein